MGWCFRKIPRKNVQIPETLIALVANGASSTGVRHRRPPRRPSTPTHRPFGASETDLGHAHQVAHVHRFGIESTRVSYWRDDRRRRHRRRYRVPAHGRDDASAAIAGAAVAALSAHVVSTVCNGISYRRPGKSVTRVFIHPLIFAHQLLKYEKRCIKSEAISEKHGFSTCP